jgi:hypothetical protein
MSVRVVSVRSYAFLLFALFVLVFSSARVLAQADLKNHVSLIRTNYHQETRDAFTSLATHFADQGEKELGDFFNAYPTAGGAGTTIDYQYVSPAAANSARPARAAGLRPFSLVFIGLGFNAGDSNGHGTVYSQTWFPGSSGDSADKGIFSWTASVTAESNLTGWLWLETQLSLVQKGRYYQSNYPPDSDPTNDWWVSENILYLQVPVMAKIRLLIDQGLSFTLAAGPALNVAVTAGGSYWDWYDVQHALPSDWYNGFLNRVVVSAVAEAGFYFGLGGSALGIVARIDYDLTGDFTYVIPDTSRFLTVSGGLRWVLPVYTSAGNQRQ